MCQITSNEVAVVVNENDKHEVQFVSVNDGRLVMGTKLEFQHPCFGIARNKKDLYLTSGTALYKYSISGTRLNKLYKDTTAGTTVSKCAVSPSGDRIFVTNPNQNTVLTLARDGTVLHIFTHPDLQTPSGIHVTAKGQVLVCGRASFNVLQLDGEGKKKLATTLKTDDCSPLAVFYNESTASIIVGSYHLNHILVFKVQ
ncbi:uncharacterized protein LOC127856442 [Dreissena polymorpha]|uniref:uncharacterized protein LOC127856442 n=1 Tax=Dreissena polymorpha TaxID=45954 RepID=UPI002264B468|nr:uncharacterized protein LOC127856442 [Dreissena polymorpha]